MASSINLIYFQRLHCFVLSYFYFIELETAARKTTLISSNVRKETFHNIINLLNRYSSLAKFNVAPLYHISVG